MQKLVLTQLTPKRWLSWVLLVLGEATRLHLLPFHFSIRVWSFEALRSRPVAMQKPVLTQLTPPRWLFWVLLLLGEVTRFQVLPFHFSIRVWSFEPFEGCRQPCRNSY